MKYIFAILILFTHSIYSYQKYDLGISNDLKLLSRKVAKAQIGVREVGHNRGFEIDLYNITAGAKKGSPYCASGQYYCYQVASELLDVPNPLPKTAVANNLFNYAKKHGKKAKFVPVIDDFLVWNYPNSWKGHVERVIEVLKGGFVRTIAFNVSLGIDVGNDGKGGVTYKLRNIYTPLARMRVKGLIG